MIKTIIMTIIVTMIDDDGGTMLIFTGGNLSWEAVTEEQKPLVDTIEADWVKTTNLQTITFNSSYSIISTSSISR